MYMLLWLDPDCYGYGIKSYYRIVLLYQLIPSLFPTLYSIPHHFCSSLRIQTQAYLLQFCWNMLVMSHSSLAYTTFLLLTEPTVPCYVALYNYWSGGRLGG